MLWIVLALWFIRGVYRFGFMSGSDWMSKETAEFTSQVIKNLGISEKDFKEQADWIIMQRKAVKK